MKIRGLITRLLDSNHIRHLMLCSLALYSILVHSVYCRHHDIGSSGAHQLEAKHLLQSSLLSSSSQSSSSLAEKPTLNKDSGNYSLNFAALLLVPFSQSTSHLLARFSIYTYIYPLQIILPLKLSIFPAFIVTISMCLWMLWFRMNILCYLVSALISSVYAHYLTLMTYSTFASGNRVKSETCDI